MPPLAHPGRQPQQLGPLPGVQSPVDVVGEDRQRLHRRGHLTGRVDLQHPGPGEQHQGEGEIPQLPVAQPPERRTHTVATVEHRPHRAVTERLGQHVRHRPRAALTHGRDELRMPPAALRAGAPQHFGEVVAAAEEPTGADRDGQPHPVGARIAGEHRPQGDHHLFGGGEHPSLPVGLPRDP